MALWSDPRVAAISQVPHEQDLVERVGRCCRDPENGEAHVLDFSSLLTSTRVLRECRVPQHVVGVDVPEDHVVLELWKVLMAQLEV